MQHEVWPAWLGTRVARFLCKGNAFQEKKMQPKGRSSTLVPLHQPKYVASITHNVLTGMRPELHGIFFDAQNPQLKNG